MKWLAPTASYFTGAAPWYVPRLNMKLHNAAKFACSDAKPSRQEHTTLLITLNKIMRHKQCGMRLWSEKVHGRRTWLRRVHPSSVGRTGCQRTRSAHGRSTHLAKTFYEICSQQGSLRVRKLAPHPHEHDAQTDVPRSGRLQQSDSHNGRLHMASTLVCRTESDNYEALIAAQTRRRVNGIIS